MTRLDGNIAAGLLYEAFGTDMTVVAGSCADCASTYCIGEWHAYRGAGTVLRCPSCGSLGLVLIERGDDVRWHLGSMEGLTGPDRPS